MLSQLRAKHPQRSADIFHPSMEKIKAERAIWEVDSDALENMDMDKDSKLETEPEETVENPNSFPYLIINKEQILAAAKKAKRMTSGGIQQITPWLLKRAFIEDTTNDCAITAAQVATRGFFQCIGRACR